MITQYDNNREDFYFSRIINHQTTLTYMLSKVRGIFNYVELPLTIPRDILEGYLTQNGSAVVYEYEGNLFVSSAVPESEPDVYGRNTLVRIDHGALGNREQLTRHIGKDAVLICNDPEKSGLLPLLEEYSAQMAQAKLSMLRSFVDLRSTRIIQAKDENAKEGAVEYEEALRRGDISILVAEELGDMSGIVVHPTPTQGNPATQVIEMTQYVQSLYYGELGLDVNNNMKRSYVSNDELEKTTGAPLLDVMLDCRQDAIRDINAIFGTDITVTISDAWLGRSELESKEKNNEEPESASQGDSAEDSSPGTSDEPVEPESESEPEEVSKEPEGSEESPETPEPVTAEEVVEAAEAMSGEDNA